MSSPSAEKSIAGCERGSTPSAVRINRSLTASWEARILTSLGRGTPRWINSDHLTMIGLLAQVGAGIGYWLARVNRLFLLLVIVCMVLNWLGDSLDGTVARVRGQQRPRYGFYVDHVVDVIGSIALMMGLGFSGFIHWPVAIAMLVGFLVLASESYLATYTLSRFELSQGLFGPTEIRILLIAGDLALLRSPYSTILGHRLLLFDVGGVIAAGSMLVMAAATIVRHTMQLYCEEPLPRPTTV